MASWWPAPASRGQRGKSCATCRMCTRGSPRSRLAATQLPRHGRRRRRQRRPAGSGSGGSERRERQQRPWHRPTPWRWTALSTPLSRAAAATPVPVAGEPPLCAGRPRAAAVDDDGRAGQPAAAEASDGKGSRRPGVGPDALSVHRPVGAAVAGGRRPHPCPWRGTRPLRGATTPRPRPRRRHGRLSNCPASSPCRGRWRSRCWHAATAAATVAMVATTAVATSPAARWPRGWAWSSPPPAATHRCGRLSAAGAHPPPNDGRRPPRRWGARVAPQTSGAAPPDGGAASAGEEAASAPQGGARVGRAGQGALGGRGGRPCGCTRRRRTVPRGTGPHLDSDMYCTYE